MRKLTIMVLVLAVAFTGSALGNTLHTLDRGEIHKEGTGEASRGNLDCSGAIEVDISSGQFIHTHTNVGAPNNVTYYGCSGWNESGGEVVYRVVFPDDVTWEVGLSNMVCDLDLAVLDMCDEDLGCLMVVDVGVYVSEPYPGEFYFVVDGYAGAACGYTITFTTTPYQEPEPISFCDLIEDPINETGWFSGDTCVPGVNNSPEFLGGGYGAGYENYYEVFMPAGSRFQVDLTFDDPDMDAVVHVVDFCTEPITSLAYYDDEWYGSWEYITFPRPANPTYPEDRIVYLVIDSYFSSVLCGTYNFEFIQIEGEPVATEIRTLTSVKSLFQ